MPQEKHQLIFWEINVARNIEDIQQDIERTRRQLASTLDQLADRSKPKNLVDDAKRGITAKLQDPQTQKIIAAVGAAVAGLIVVAAARNRKRNKDIKELQRLLAARD
ncbi:hypothetical protein Clow_02070 [Corynebacterium lowii]|uniref:DUF3618 domain-containing protein n=1 Tax=Corynebacterium lowii TaxID=1544413 RepID=A0A0Q0UAK6_9CORY|nr:hypothetical protein Clow_02070 [Corynebacterium lowii]